MAEAEKIYRDTIAAGEKAAEKGRTTEAIYMAEAERLKQAKLEEFFYSAIVVTQLLPKVIRQGLSCVWHALWTPVPPHPHEQRSLSDMVMAGSDGSDVDGRK